MRADPNGNRYDSSADADDEEDDDDRDDPDDTLHYNESTRFELDRKLYKILEVSNTVEAECTYSEDVNDIGRTLSGLDMNVVRDAIRNYEL